MKGKRLLALTCEALARSIYASAATSPHTVTTQFYRQGLHNTPKLLRQTLQEQIDAVPPDTYDAILLVYGICGMSTVGLQTEHTPLVMPRAHDCITLYLGSRELYQTEFEAHPGTYWYSLDYMERNESGAEVALGAANLGLSEELYQTYVEKYGKDNADYLMEVMGEWGKHYDRAVYIDMGFAQGDKYEAMAKDQADRRGWMYERKQGNRRLLSALVNGHWDESDFLIVPPNHKIDKTSDDALITAIPI